MSRDDQSHLPLRTVHDRKLREDSGPGGLLVGYAAGGDSSKPLPGDEKFPFIMVPPDLAETNTYAAIVGRANMRASLPIVDSSAEARLNAFARGPAIDVRGVRLLTFYFSLQALMNQYGDDDVNAFNIIPQVANSKLAPTQLTNVTSSYTNPDTSTQIPQPPNLLWHTISVIDPFIRGSFPTALNPPAAFGAPAYGFRNVHMTQLVFPLNAVGQANIHTTLVFDVAPYEYFRLNWAFGKLTTPPDVAYTFPPSGDDTVLNDYFQLAYQAER